MRDAALRYVAIVPFRQLFRFQVRVRPERGADLTTPIEIYEVKRIADPADKRQGILKSTIFVTTMVVAALLGIGLAKDSPREKVPR